MEKELQVAVFGGGCFWCTEAVFQEVRGVVEVTSGYTGGHVDNPTYEDICTGKSGHAEVVRIVFDSNIIKYHELLNVFFATHDPTTLNQQGADKGTQYRSAIFTSNDEQLTECETMIFELNEKMVFSKDIVTQIEPLGLFYKAEAYHQNYYNNNTLQGYCHFVISPKLAKFKELFSHKLSK